MNPFALRWAALLVALAIAGCGGDPFGTSAHVNCNDANKCLPTDQSLFGTYCHNVSNKTQVCDCPGGSPGNGCVLTPTGSANVYCCP